MLVDFLLRKIRDYFCAPCFLSFCFCKLRQDAIKSAHCDSVRICLCEKRAKRRRLGSRSTGVATVGRGVDVATRDDSVDDKVHRGVGEQRYDDTDEGIHNSILRTLHLR